MTVFGRQTGAILAALAGSVTILVLSGAAWAANTPVDAIDKDNTGASYVSGELLISLKSNTPDGQVEDLTRRAEAKVEDDLPALNSVLVSVPEVQGEQAQGAREKALAQVKEDLAKSPMIESVDYNYVRTADFIPNDPRFDHQYGLKKPGYPKAWNVTLGGGVRVGVVDSGISSRHPDLRGQVAAQKDFVNGDGVANDDVGHGSHVSGIVAAKTDNGRGIAGGCPRCKLLVAKSLGPRGGTDADISKGIVWTVDRGAKVVNLSLGGPGSSAVLQRAVNRAWKRGAVVVSAAGNEDTKVKSYPAAYKRVMAVAATTPSDHRASYSNFGDWVDVSAPGSHVLSTVPGGYRYESGTSMASPEVAALAGLLANRGLSNSGIRSRIQNTAKDLGRKGKDPYFGAGRIDAGQAVR